MRDFLNGILTFIGSTSLTDVEFEGLTIESYGYDQETYQALADVLEARESISTLQDRLVSYFEAKGVSVVANETGKTNIFIGAVLEY